MARRRKRRSSRRMAIQKDPSKQWVYFMANLPFFFTIKVGISRDRSTLWNRFKCIDAQNAGWDIPIFFIKIYGARKIEEWNKRLASKLFLKANFFSGTGHTERFLVIGAIPILLASILAFVIEWVIKIGAVVSFIYLMKGE